MFFKLRILIKLHKSAQDWNSLHDCFSCNVRLLHSLQYLIAKGFVKEDEIGTYSLSYRSALREYVFRNFATGIGTIGGLIAIAQFLASYLK